MLDWRGARIRRIIEGRRAALSIELGEGSRLEAFGDPEWLARIADAVRVAWADEQAVVVAD